MNYFKRKNTNQKYPSIISPILYPAVLQESDSAQDTVQGTVQGTIQLPRGDFNTQVWLTLKG